MKIKLIILISVIATSLHLYPMDVKDSLNYFIKNGPAERRAYYLAEYSIAESNDSLKRRYAFEAKKLLHKKDAKENFALTYIALARLYLKLSVDNQENQVWHDSALYYYNKAYKLNNYIRNDKYKGFLFSGYGFILKNLDGVNFLDSAKIIYAKLNDKQTIRKIIEAIGWIYITQGYNTKADSIYRIILSEMYHTVPMNEFVSKVIDITNTLRTYEEYNLGIKFLKDFRWSLNDLDNNRLYWEFFYNISLFEWYNSNFIDCIKPCDTALYYAQKLYDKNLIATSFELKGVIYNSMKMWDSAQAAYSNSLMYALIASNDTISARVQMNTATSYMERHDYQKAVEIFIKNKDLYKRCHYLKYPDSYNIYLFNIAECYYYMNDDKQLKKIIDEISPYDYGNSKGNIPLFYHLTIGRYYYLIKDYAKAEVNLKMALEKSRIKTNYEKTKMILDILPDVLFKMGKTAEAYEYTIEWSRTKDSLNASINSREIGRYEKEKEHAIEVQEQKVKEELSKIDLRNKNLILYIMIFAAFLLIVFSFIVLKERTKTEKLLLNILPKQIAKRLKKKEKYIAERFNEASVMFIDIANFTKLSSGIQPEKLVEILNDIFIQFDVLCEKHGLEKIKTIGDCYLAVAGIPEPMHDHAIAAANMALECMHKVKDYKTYDGLNITFRIGIDCGPVVAGIIGKNKFIYDLWGDTVNTASRMEDYGVIGEIQISDRFKNEISRMSKFKHGSYNFIDRGKIEMKGKGYMRTWLLRETE